MPLPKNQVAFSRVITLPSGFKTLGLFDKYGNFIEARICQSHRDGTFTCPKRTSQPTKRKKLAEKIGVNFQTNQPINRRKK